MKDNSFYFMLFRGFERRIWSNLSLTQEVNELNKNLFSLEVALHMCIWLVYNKKELR